MARTGTHGLLKGVSGRIGEIVVKQYGYGTVITAMPVTGTRKKKPGALQELHRHHFKAAVAYAQSVVRNPEEKEVWAKKLKKGEIVYTAAVRSFMSRGIETWNRERLAAGVVLPGDAEVGVGKVMG